jgi:hypothetical protein
MPSLNNYQLYQRRKNNRKITNQKRLELWKFRSLEVALMKEATRSSQKRTKIMKAIPKEIRDNFCAKNGGQ